MQPVTKKIDFVRRYLEKIVMIVKEEVQIGNHCKLVRESLDDLIHNQNYFSPLIAAYFKKKTPDEIYEIGTKDPTQVVALKKIMNALRNLEKAIRRLENLDIDVSQSDSARLTQIVKISWSSLHEAYGAIMTLDQCGPELETLIGPHLSRLLPKIATLHESLKPLTSQIPETNFAEALSKGVMMLPTQQISEQDSFGSISTLLFSIPHWIDSLQKLIPGKSFDQTVKNADEYRQVMATNVANLTNNLENICAKANLRSLTSLGRKLVKLTSDLCNTSAPLTRQSYLEAAKKLQGLKHDIIPAIIAELEEVELNMGLTPGVLISPAMASMEKYYTQLAETVNTMARTANIIEKGGASPISFIVKLIRWLIGNKTIFQEESAKVAMVPELTVMKDQTFIEKRRNDQLQRYSAIELESKNLQAELNSANLFFSLIQNYNPASRQILLRHYQLFQSHMAKLYPELDELIVQKLTSKEDTSSSSWSFSGKKNPFAAIISHQDCQKSVLNHIHQALSQSQIKQQLANQTIRKTEIDAQTTLSYGKKAFVAAKVTEDEAAKDPLTYNHKQALKFATQQNQLKITQHRFQQFFALFQEHCTDETALHKLPEHIKAQLREAYSHFQKHVIGARFSQLDKLIVDNLMSDKPKTIIKKGALEPMKDALKKRFSELSEYLEKNKNDYLAKETMSKEQPLKARGKELQQKSLFTQFFRLGLPKKVDSLLRETLLPSLKSQLSPPVWQALLTKNKRGVVDKDIDLAKLPYELSPTDSEEVAMYKRLINCFVSINNMLTTMEQNYHRAGRTGSYASMGMFLIGIIKIVIEIVNLMKEGSFLSLNENLSQLISENLLLITEPLKKLPLVGEFLEGALSQKSVEQPQADIVELWQEQQELMRANIDPLKRPKTLDYLSVFGLDEYEADEALAILETIDKIQSANPLLMTAKGDLAKEYEKLFPYLNKIDSTNQFGIHYIRRCSSEKELVEALENLHAKSSSYIGGGYFGQLKKLSRLSKEELIPAFQIPLIELYQKLQPYLVQIDGKYTPSYARHLTTAEEYKKLMAEIIALKPRLERVTNSIRTPAKSRDYVSLFGLGKEDTNNALAIYKTIEAIQKNGASLTAAKHKLEVEYSKLFPYLQKSDIGNNFTEDYISRCTNEAELIRAVVNLLITDANLVQGYFGQLEDLASMPFQGSSLHNLNEIYSKLQPYLVQIDSRYTNSVIERLNSVEEYQQFIKGIISQKPKLEKTVSSLTSPMSSRSIDPAKQQQELIMLTLEKQKPEYQCLFSGINPPLSEDLQAIYDRIAACEQELFTENEFDLTSPLIRARENLRYAYEELLPYLKASALADDFNANFIDKIKSAKSAEELSLMIEQLNATKSLISYQPSLYSKLHDLEQQCQGDYQYFDELSNRQGLLDLYRQLQPYLAKMDANKYTPQFLDKLKTSADFYEALTEIIGLKDTLQRTLTKPPEKSAPRSEASAITLSALMAFPAVKSGETIANYLDPLAKGLYQMSEELNKLADKDYQAKTPEEIQQQTDRFTTQFRSLGLSLQTSSKALRLIHFLMKEISEFGAVNQERILTRTQQIRTALGEELLAGADLSEFLLGLKPGQLSEPLLKQFDNFFNSFLAGLPLSEQNRLTLTTESSIEITQTRLQKEKARTPQKINKLIEQTEAILFGTAHADATTIKFHFNQLNYELSQAKLQDKSLLDIKKRLQVHYQHLRPYLLEKPALAKQFPENYILACQTNEQLLQAIEQLQATEKTVSVQLGSFAKLEALSQQVAQNKEGAFGNTPEGQKQRETLLRCFAELRPYIDRISDDYKPFERVLRELRGAPDFIEILSKLLALKDELKASIAGLKVTQQSEQEKTKDRITYLESQLAVQKQSAPHIIKDSLFSFALNQIKKEFSQDLSKELGPFTKLFFTHLEPQIQAKKEFILNGLEASQSNLQQKIHDNLELHVTGLISLDHQELKDTYAKLFHNLQTLDQLIAQEKTKLKTNPGNLYRQETLVYLETIRSEFSSNLERFVEAKMATEGNAKLEQVLTSSKERQQIAELYNILKTMKNHLEQTQKTEKDPRLDHINSMLTLLAKPLKPDQPAGTTLHAIEHYFRASMDEFTRTPRNKPDPIFNKYFVALRNNIIGKQPTAMLDSLQRILLSTRTNVPKTRPRTPEPPSPKEEKPLASASTQPTKQTKVTKQLFPEMEEAPDPEELEKLEAEDKGNESLSP